MDLQHEIAAEAFHESRAALRPLCSCGTHTHHITACDGCDRRMCVYCASDRAWDTSVCDDCRAEREYLAQPDEAQEAPKPAEIVAGILEEAA